MRVRVMDCVQKALFRMVYHGLLLERATARRIRDARAGNPSEPDVAKDGSRAECFLNGRRKGQRLKRAIEKLPDGDIKKLRGYSQDYRLRVGDLRVLFSVNGDIITVKDVLPRGQAYKRL